MEDDLRAVVDANVDGVIIPKVDRPEVLLDAATLLAELEQKHELADGQVRILPLIETARGVAHCEQIALAAPSRVVTLVFGLVDFAHDVGFDLTEDATELLYARSRIVVAARAGNLRPAIDGPYLGLRDPEGLLVDSRRSCQLGFQGRVVVYPPQVEHVQQAYSELDANEVEQNRRIVDAFEQAEAAGSASIQVDGRFVDYPIFERARHKLRLFDALTMPAGQRR
jgi:citrate lyase subunit beta/citryl-CoA lyase